MTHKRSLSFFFHFNDHEVDSAAWNLHWLHFLRCVTEDQSIQAQLLLCMYVFIYLLLVCLCLSSTTARAKMTIIHSVSPTRKLLTLSASLFWKRFDDSVKVGEVAQFCFWKLTVVKWETSWAESQGHRKVVGGAEIQEIPLLGFCSLRSESNWNWTLQLRYFFLFFWERVGRSSQTQARYFIYFWPHWTASIWDWRKRWDLRSFQSQSLLTGWFRECLSFQWVIIKKNNTHIQRCCHTMFSTSSSMFSSHTDVASTKTVLFSPSEPRRSWQVSHTLSRDYFLCRPVIYS